VLFGIDEEADGGAVGDVVGSAHAPPAEAFYLFEGIFNVGDADVKRRAAFAELRLSNAAGDLCVLAGGDDGLVVSGRLKAPVEGLLIEVLEFFGVLAGHFEMNDGIWHGFRISS